MMTSRVGSRDLEELRVALELDDLMAQAGNFFGEVGQTIRIKFIPS